MASRDQTELQSLALWPIVLLVYLPAMLSVDFIWDDFVIGTDTVRTLAGVRQIWFFPAEIPPEGHYWPLTYTSLWLEHKLWGGIASGYHATNVLLHLANTLLLWHLLCRLTVPWAWVGGGGVRHPSRTRRVGGMVHRAQGRAVGLVLPAGGLGVDPLRGAAASAQVPVRLAAYVAGLLSKSVVVDRQLTNRGASVGWCSSGTYSHAGVVHPVCR